MEHSKIVKNFKNSKFDPQVHSHMKIMFNDWNQLFNFFPIEYIALINP